MSSIKEQTELRIERALLDDIDCETAFWLLPNGEGA